MSDYEKQPEFCDDGDILILRAEDAILDTSPFPLTEEQWKEWRKRRKREKQVRKMREEMKDKEGDNSKDAEPK